MSTEDAALPAAPRVEGPPPHLLIVRAPYYRAVVDGLTDGAYRLLREAGATVGTLDVAGAYELPQAIRIAVRGSRFDGFVALGCVVRGETDHYDFICRATMAGMMTVALQFGLCLGTGLLTVDTSPRPRRVAAGRLQQGRRSRRRRAAADQRRPPAGRGLMARPPKTRTRTASPVAAVQALFQAEQAGDNPEAVIDQFVRHRLGDLEGQDDSRTPASPMPR